jgi:hypothetical protein
MLLGFLGLGLTGYRMLHNGRGPSPIVNRKDHLTPALARLAAGCGAVCRRVDLR